MSNLEAIESFIENQPEAKRAHLRTLHNRIQAVFPDGPMTYLDGTDATGKVVTNPSIAYGTYVIHYANGTTRESHQVGLSVNATGFSVYIMGIDDKDYLSREFGPTIGKAKVTGYCIRFISLQHIDLETLISAVLGGAEYHRKRQ